MPGSTGRVAILDAGYGDYGPEQAVLEPAGYALDVFDGGRHDQDGKLAFAQDADGVMVRWTEVDGAFLDALPKLQGLVRYGVGYDNVDIPAATARGIPVANVRRYANQSVSDHALALMLGLLRGLPQGMRTFHATYGRQPQDDMPDLCELTLGIIGLGQIGGTLAKKVQGLVKRVIACDPYIPPSRFVEHGATPVDLPTLFATSDIISLHCNLSEETRHLLDAAAFAQMARRPIVINTARGAVIDEMALIAALESGRIHSAGIDVFSEEPPGEAFAPLLEHPRAIATGHYAFYSNQAMITLQRRAAENMLALLQGNMPGDCLNPEVFGG